MERRDFIKFLPAAFVAIAAGCRRPEEKIVPGIYPGSHTKAGIPEYFNTLYSYGSVCYGITAKLYDGRPVKIDGNTEHPVNRGKSNAQIQASLYSLYDPKRFVKPRIGGRDATLDEALKYWQSRIKSDIDENKNIRILINEHCSPAFSKLINEIEERFENVRFVVLSPNSSNRDERTVNKKLFGIDKLFYHDLSKVKYIISFGSDFLGKDEQSLSNSIQYSNNDFKIITFESEFSLTGANSDRRYALHPFDMEKMIESLLSKYLNKIGNEILVKEYGLRDNIKEQNLNYLVDKLINNRGEVLFLSGDQLSMRSKEIITLLNYYSGAYDDILKERDFDDKFYCNYEAINNLINDLNNQKVSSLIISDLDIEYLSPSLMSLILDNVDKDHIIVHSLYHTETCKKVKNYIPCTHFLESWGDGITYDGFRSIRQPLIMPLNSESISFEDLMIKMFTEQDIYYDYLRKVSTDIAPDDIQWEKILRKGYVNNNVYDEEIKVDIKLNNISLSEGSINANNELCLLTLPSQNLKYGEFSEIDWLKELPDPINKTVWKSYAYMNETTAANNGLVEGDIIKLSSVELSAKLPVCLNERIADNSVIYYLGYEKYKYLYDFTKDNVQQIKLKNTGDKSNILRVNKNSISINDLHFSSYKENSKSSENFKYKNHKWTMVIDSNKCIGCNSCIMACQIENNIAIVGEKEIEKDRPLHWIRVENAVNDKKRMSFIPIMCQHCDNAPCEKVCPVSATTHSPEGINEMTYNRCIGTRYCMANCPYDVRRFNYKEYNNNKDEPYEYIYNPQVTVRMRGIVEKCTFCVQRINEEKYKQKNKGRNQIPDGAFQTACQQACPTSAISFGNILDNNSVVYAKIKHEKTFRMLEEKNTQPSVHYILKQHDQ